MNKKNIYLIQAGFGFDNSLYFPYAVGTLAAYAWADPEISEFYNLKELVFTRKDIKSFVKSMENPFLAGFSNYVWNFEYNKALAKAIKREYPSCVILFGGHSVPPGTALLEQESYVDILMYGEGEVPFTKLLKALKITGIARIPNIAYRKVGKIHVNRREEYPDISSYPSPYSSGLFDKLISDNPDVDFLAVLETNRGCVHNCAYCDWCIGKKLRQFPIERVRADIDWLSKNKIEYCFCADANFGIFGRDEEIVDYIIQNREKYGYPKVFRPCYAKDKDERVFSISKKLNAYGMDKGATMAYQTLSPAALSNINRKNLTLGHFSKLLAMYNEAAIPAYSELILGMPGETYESFCEGICRLIESG
ncbi:MAG: hypothetical protein FWF08_06375, partial [Oscillospiraceae bacterium]|nr:hypothetical protein [Oscillospiraceae bacterium]